MIGMKVTSTAGETFTVAATDNGRVILAPDDFGQSVAVSLASFLTDYTTIDGSAVPSTLPPSEVEALRDADAARNRTINQEYGRAVAGMPRTDTGRKRHEVLPLAGSPEAIFRDLADNNDSADIGSKRQRRKGTS